jgi:hypothetical protein
MGGLKGLIPTIITLFTSINPQQTAFQFEHLVQTILDFKDAILGVTKTQNMGLKEQALNLLAGSQLGDLKDNSPVYELWEQQQKINAEIIKAQANGDAERVGQLQTIAALNDRMLSSLQKQEAEVERIKDAYTDIETAMAYSEQVGSKKSVINFLESNASLTDKKNYLQSLSGTDLGAMGFGKSIKNAFKTTD